MEHLPPALSGGGTGCLTNVLEPKGIKTTSYAKVAFEINGNPPLLEEAVATYSNATTTLTNCKSVRANEITGTVGQMSFLHYGNASAAFVLSATSQGTTVDVDFLIVRKGNVIMRIEEAAVSPVDVSQFQGFVVEALAKVK